MVKPSRCYGLTNHIGEIALLLWFDSECKTPLCINLGRIPSIKKFRLLVQMSYSTVNVTCSNLLCHHGVGT